MKYHILKMLMSHLKIKLQNKNGHLSTILTQRFDIGSIHSNIKTNIMLLNLVKQKLLCCSWRQQIHVWRSLYIFILFCKYNIH